MIAKKIAALVLSGVFIISCLFGCEKKMNSSSSSKAVSTREETESLTFEAVNELNKGSELGDYSLLDPLPYPMEIPGSGTMNQGEDSFNCFPYAGENYITRLFLSSGAVNVFGVSNGHTEASADEALHSRGYQKIADYKTSGIFLASEVGVAYSKYDITIAFRFSSTTDVIDKIIIVVQDPTVEDITY